VARECEGPERVKKTDCPRQCRRQQGAANGDRAHDRASAPDQVEWAGLPINLDFAFSREQRDKVYVQHLMRKQGSQLWRLLHDGAQPCVCEGAAEGGTLDPDTAESVQSR
jgi:hypothetical protein